MQWGKSIQKRLWPAIPQEIRDELALLRFSRLQAQIPILYVTLVLVVLTAMLAATMEAPFAIRVGIPLTVAAAAVARFSWWVRQRTVIVDPAHARRQIRRMLWVSSGIAAMCSAWCVISWSLSEPGERAYFPMMLAMGALSTVFCLSVVRAATLSNLSITLLPISAAQITAGTEMDRIAGAVTLIAAAFLLRLIIQQHQQLVDLLMLKHHLREQANTDPLTGLLNRRALLAAMRSANSAKPMALALVDLDGFKPVNDNLGHGAGDELLVQIAQRMLRSCGRDALVARVGGDEFAIFVLGETAQTMRGRVDHMLGSLAKPFIIEKTRLTIGASAGIAGSPADTSDAEALIASADRALYAAKAVQRGTANAAPPTPLTLSGTRG